MWHETVRLGDQAFPFACTIDARQTAVEVLGELAPDQVILLTDETVALLHADRIERALRREWPVVRLVVAADETAKNLTSVERLCEAALLGGATRRSVVVALGGGMVGNLAGVLAGLMFRGIRLVHIPTTLLAAADAVVSLKQAVNAAGAKNSFGLYLAPKAVVVDLESFATLPEAAIRSGVAELIKNAVAIEPGTATVLTRLGRIRHRWGYDQWSDLVRLGVAAKQHMLADDPLERNAGLAFEYGHTVGHAVEWASARSAAPLSHGESIAFGMRVAALIAEWTGIAAPALRHQLEIMLADAGLVQAPPHDLSLDTVIDIVARDNKRGRIETGANACAMVLLREPGRPAGDPALPLVPVPFDVVRKAIDRVTRDLAPSSPSKRMRSPMVPEAAVAR